MIVAATSTLVSLLSPIVTGVIFIIGGISAWVTFRLRRRRESGTVGTSEASSLWTQTQAMLANSQEARINAEHQRDQLLESQSSVVAPALTAMNESMKQTQVMLVAILDKLNKETP